MQRRSFLKGGLAASAAAAVMGQGFWQQAFAAPAVPGVGPYGPLSATPDANGLFLPPGFTSRIVGVSGQPVTGTSYTWHGAPDGGATYAHPDGSWTYVSNCEQTPGGAGSITFAADGAIIGARRILDGTRNNCAGGPTSWGTWMSCEETGTGYVFDCDPLGSPESAVRLDALGQRAHEATAVDAIGKIIYTTEDHGTSRFYRWVPAEWTGLRPNFAAGGQLQALQADLGAALLGPTPVTWVEVSDISTGYRGGDSSSFARGEGCWIDGQVVYFCTTSDSVVWAVDGVNQTIAAVYVGGTGALTQADNITVHAPSGDLIVAEDAGNQELVIITSPYDSGTRVVTPFMRFDTPLGGGSEVAGPAFSPDGTRLYVSSQRGVVGSPGGNGSGVTYEISGPFRTSRGGPGGPVLPEILIPFESTWKISDTGLAITPGFAASSFDDTSWKIATLTAGKVFGYGDDDSQSPELSFGPDAGQKYRTTYFRHTFAVTAPGSLTDLTIDLIRDDGAVVYLNGVEVMRSNMPAGPIDHLTLAVINGPERDVNTLVIPNTLVAGDNTIAVEIHQVSAGSSDMAFKLRLTAVQGPDDPPPVVPEAPIPVLLAVTGAAALGAAVLINSRRNETEPNIA